MDKAVRPVLPEKRDRRENNYKTVNYSFIPGSNRNHQARTARGAWIDHPTREYPQFLQAISIEYAAACVPQAFVPTMSFLPVIVASMRGASRFLHTGPVALLSLMSAAAIEPLASRCSEEFIQLSMLLALLVGVLRLAPGLFRMGVLINLASHPVILGFTNAPR